jgi:endonuclease-3
MAAKKPKVDTSNSAAILRILKKTYPDAKCELDFRNPLELTVATILSAQCTDRRVNAVTPALFKKYPTAKALAAADRAELENIIMSTGFFRAKANSILGMAAKVCDEFGGEVPNTLEDLGMQLVFLPL